MNGTPIHIHASAFIHIVLFLLIVGGGTLVMLEMTQASRTGLNAQDLSRPIPEMVRWQSVPN